MQRSICAIDQVPHFVGGDTRTCEVLGLICERLADAETAKEFAVSGTIARNQVRVDRLGE
jgi:hypothetical protein